MYHHLGRVFSHRIVALLQEARDGQRGGEDGKQLVAKGHAEEQDVRPLVKPDWHSLAMSQLRENHVTDPFERKG
jgi:hypothetical protein